MNAPRLGLDSLEGLPVPDMFRWSIFPIEGDFTVRTVEPFEAQDFPRDGERGGKPCHCESEEDRWPKIWSNERWEVRPLKFRPDEDAGAPFPAYMLQTVEHLDLGDFDESLAAELGVMTLRMRHAIMAIGDIGRVHINRWGDGGSHFHMWFLGRPLGAWQFSGFSLPLWGHVLPPLPPNVLAANHEVVSSSLDRQSGV